MPRPPEWPSSRNIDGTPKNYKSFRAFIEALPDGLFSTRPHDRANSYTLQTILHSKLTTALQKIQAIYHVAESIMDMQEYRTYPNTHENENFITFVKVENEGGKQHELLFSYSMSAIKTPEEYRASLFKPQFIKGWLSTAGKTVFPELTKSLSRYKLNPLENKIKEYDEKSPDTQSAQETSRSAPLGCCCFGWAYSSSKTPANFPLLDAQNTTTYSDTSNKPNPDDVACLKAILSIITSMDASVAAKKATAPPPEKTPTRTWSSTSPPTGDNDSHDIAFQARASNGKDWREKMIRNLTGQPPPPRRSASAPPTMPPTSFEK